MLNILASDTSFHVKVTSFLFVDCTARPLGTAAFATAGSIIDTFKALDVTDSSPVLSTEVTV
ncbi:hypothetical protein D3C71_1421580 [compost metagenome]